MLGWLRKWLEDTAEKISKTKVRVFLLQVTALVSVVTLIILGKIHAKGYVRVAQQAVKKPRPLHGGFIACKSGGLVNIAFPSASIPSAFDSIFEKVRLLLVDGSGGWAPCAANPPLPSIRTCLTPRCAKQAAATPISPAIVCRCLQI